MEKLETQMNQALWIAHTLFALGKTSGSSANLSFRQGNEIYITASGTCFGTLTEEDFSVLALDGSPLRGKRASKESPLHLRLYQSHPETAAVIHTHGPHAVLWSCVPGLDPNSCIPSHTPYLNMKLGPVRLVPYAQPGSEALFAALDACLWEGRGYLLKRHGALVGGKSLMDAFYCVEELEDASRVAWELYRAGISTLDE